MRQRIIELCITLHLVVDLAMFLLNPASQLGFGYIRNVKASLPQ